MQFVAPNALVQRRQSLDDLMLSIIHRTTRPIRSMMYRGWLCSLHRGEEVPAAGSRGLEPHTFAVDFEKNIFNCFSCKGGGM